MTFTNALPIPAFPGFTHFGVVADQVKEIVVTFNAESIDALNSVPDKSVAWADVGTRVTQGMFEVKIPIRLAASLGFTPFDGTRKYQKLNIAAPIVKTTPFDLNFEWPIQIQQSGITQLAEFYGASGLAQAVVDAGRAYKAQLVASLIINGFTNTALGVTATALTIPQPGNPNGLPLFTDGSTTAKHYAHPFNANSGRFANLFLGAGTFQSAIGTVLTNMARVPHPSLPNMPLGAEVTDFIGGTNMLIPFWQTAIQTLSLQTTTTPGNIGAATTNIYNPDLIKQAGAEKLVGASGLAPWRFWIAPQLDAHPYLVANPTAQMWIAVCDKGPAKGSWAELAAPNKAFTPVTQLLGDGSEEAKKTRMVRMLNDLDAGVAAGLPHFAAMYFEGTPSA